jgi:hypothetical protein
MCRRPLHFSIPDATMRPSPTRDGSTLIEPIVTVIIGGQAVIAFSSFRGVRERGRQTSSADDGWAGVTTHTSLVSAQCGLAMSGPPLLLALPTTVAGVVACTNLD